MKNEDRNNLLIILAVVLFFVWGFILSGIFMKPSPKKTMKLQQPVNRLQKIRQGIVK